jgi:predicted HTH domain antitoxin
MNIARELRVATLYAEGKLSARQARETLGLTRRAFEELLQRNGLSVMVDSQENLDIELKAAVVPPPLEGGR